MLKGLLEDVIEACEEDFEGLASELEETMREEAPRGSRFYAQEMTSMPWNEYRPGALKDSITKEKVSNTEYLIGVDADKLEKDSRNPSHVDYSPMVQNGTKRVYTLVRKSGRPFVWVDEMGKKHFAHKIKMPPRKANDFVARAVSRFDAKVK